MTRRIILGTILSLTLLAGPAWSAGYAAFKGGFYFPEEDVLDTGYSLRLAAAMSLGALGAQPASSPDANRIFLEGALGYYTADVEGPFDGELEVIPLTASLIIQQALSNSPVSVQAGGGLGLYFADAEVRVPGFPNARASNSDVELGLHLTAGMAFALSQTLDFTADLDWDIVTDDVGGAFLQFGLRSKF